MIKVATTSTTQTPTAGTPYARANKFEEFFLISDLNGKTLRIVWNKTSFVDWLTFKLMDVVFADISVRVMGVDKNNLL